MLTIRDAQMKVFRLRKDRDFARSLLAPIRRRSPEAVAGLDDRECLRRILAGIQKARSYSIADGEAIYEFVLLLFELAPNFDQHHTVQAALAGNPAQADATVHSVRFLLTPADKLLIRDGYGAMDWELLVESYLPGGA